MPLNETLHFLRDLIVLILLAPLIGLFLRRQALVGFALVLGIFLTDFDGHLINRNTMAVLFYVGGWAATSKFKMNSFDHLGKYSLVFLIAAYLGTMYFEQDYTYVYLVAPFAVWPAASLLVNTRVGEWLTDKGKYSFFLFLIHRPMIRVIELFHAKFFSGEWSNTFVFVAFAAIIVSTFLIYDAAIKIAPDVFRFLIGGRSEKNKHGAILNPAEKPAAGAPA